MLQRGRKSAVNKATTISVTGKSPRLTAPSSLTSAEKALFNELVGETSSDHFRSTDVPLLISYVQSTLMARSAGGNPKLIGQFEKAVKLQAVLATRLRLSPQSRVDPKTLGRAQDQFHRLRYPWESAAQHHERCRAAGFEPDEGE